MTITEQNFRGFIKGDEKSFEAIFGQYYKVLVSFAMHYGLEQMEAEDVVIEVIHHIWEIRTNVKSPIALNSLFFTAVRNRTMNIVRNLKNQNRIIQSQDLQEKEFSDYVTEEEITYALDKAIKALPEKCRLVILMLLQGKTTGEIAGEMRISVNTVRTYKMRAIKILKDQFADNSLILWILLFRLSD